ncbi:HNH endonuclease [Paenibacillus sp. BAC0078]
MKQLKQYKILIVKKGLTKMHESFDKNKFLVRAALFIVYEGRCYYDGLPIRFKDMHIDHIIPEFINDKDLEKITKDFEFTENFNVNSLYNLVPCSPNANLSKNKNVYPLTYLEKRILDKSINKVQEIKNKIEQLASEYKDDRQFIKLSARLREYDTKEKLEELYNQLANEKPFEVVREVQQTSHQYIFKRSLSNVHLMGFLPQYPDMKGSCLITFSNLRLRDCMVTLNHSQIMSILFEGAKTKIEHTIRSYIIHSDVLNPDIYYVDLANVRIPLERKEVEQLIEIIDDYYNLYMEEARKLYEFFRMDLFNKSNYKNRLKLFKVNKQLWFLLLKFCREFDYDRGNTEWHIFDGRGSMIKIYDKSKGEFRLFVHAEVERNDFVISHQEQVWLVWTDEFFWNKQISDFEQNHFWSPEKAYRWLINELIPYVIYFYSENKNRLFRKKITYDEFRYNFQISNYAFELPFISNDALLDKITVLQLFYSTYKDDVYQRNELENLYSCLILIIQKTTLDHNGVRDICDKLGVRNIETTADLIKAINNLIVSINDEKVYSGYFIDLIFRGMVISLRDYRNTLSAEDEKKIEKKLELYAIKMENDQIRRTV